MTQYIKIQSVFKRDTNKNIILNDFSLPEFEYLQHSKWEFTEKIDGTNIRVCHANGVTNFFGKTDDSQIPARLVARLRAIFDPLADQLNKQFPDGICLYAEGCGPKIQKNGENYGDEQDIILFDVKISGLWLQRADVNDIASKLKLRSAPVICSGNISDMVEIVRRGFTSTYGDFIAEGIVARPKLELQDRRGQRIITKLKTRDFSSIK